MRTTDDWRGMNKKLVEPLLQLEAFAVWVLLSIEAFFCSSFVGSCLGSQVLE